MAATAFLIVVRARLGPLLAGAIFWIPIVVLLIELLLVNGIIPFGRDVVGIAELVAAIIGVVAAHNTYHKLPREMLGRVSFNRNKAHVRENFEKL